MIEHYGGAFPFWLSPEQVRILPIADRHLDFAKDLKDKLMALDIRVEIDERAERLPAKIRNAQLEKIPHMIVLGDKEVESSQVNLRTRDGEQESFSVDKYLEKIREISRDKSS